LFVTSRYHVQRRSVNEKLLAIIALGLPAWKQDPATHNEQGETVSTATATTYQGTFHGRAEEVARVRKEIAAYLGECPVADDLVLIVDELASNSILHTHSRGKFFRVRCELAPGTARIEVEDMGGPWRTRKDDDRPHGLDIVEALTGPGGWGTQTTGDGGRIVWASLTW
jgi:anti-sigma regulatory factor (Ser/Thr protein kinase)